MKKIFAGMFALVAMTASAMAADPYPRVSLKDTPDGVTVDNRPLNRSWTQLFVGLNGACEAGITEADVPGFLNFRGLGSSGCSFAPFVGADYQMPNSILVIGVEGEYRWGNDETTGRIDNGWQTFKASAGIDSSWLVSGRVGALIGPETLLYGRIGFGQAKGGWDFSIACNESGETVTKGHGDLPEFDIIAYGLGLEHRFWDGQAAIRVEYRHTDFSEEKVFGNAATIQPSFDAGLVGISYRLGR